MIRAPRRRRRLRLLAPLTLLLALVLPGSPARAADPATVLPVTGRVNAVVADAHGHLFFATDGGVLVTDTRGHRLRTVSYNQVLDLALSRDGNRLYVAERGNVAVSTIDTTSLRVTARYALPPGMCPVSVAVTATRLAFAHSCDGQTGGIGFLRLDDLRAKPVTWRSPGDAGISLIKALPGNGDRILAAAAALAPASVSVLSPAGISRQARLEGCDNLRDVALAPNGTSFVPACGAPYRFDRYDLSTLKVTGSLLAGPYPDAVAFSPSGRLLAGGVDAASGPDVYVYPQAANPRKAVELGGAAAPRGLVFSPAGTTLYAVALTTGGTYVLHTLPGESA